jgi:amino acid permease
MRKAISSSLSCSFVFYMAISITGYMALGDFVPGDILTGFSSPSAVVTAGNAMVLIHMISAYQVFSQPVFHGCEEFIMRVVPWFKRQNPLVLRVIVRSLYVAMTTTIACVMPFFTDIIGLIGALVFWPAAVYFPVTMYIKVYNPRGVVKGILQGMNVTAALVSLLAGMGAVWQIVYDVGKYRVAEG